MSTLDPSANFSRLLSLLSDGELSQSEFEEVEQYLLDNPEARQTYFDYVDINTGINNRTAEKLKEREQIFISTVPQSVSDPSSVLNPISPIRYLVVAAAIVSLILGAEWFMAGHFFWEKPPLARVEPLIRDLPDTYVATLSRSANCIWGNDKRPLFSGQRLLSKDLFLKEGIAEFRFDSGIRLVLEGPTEIKIESANSARLISGSVVLHGHESAPEFELVTSQAKFFDVGTLYGIKAAENSGTEIHVFEGSVRIQPLEESSQDEDQIQIVNQGVAQYIDKNINNAIALNPDKFKREVPKSPKDPKVFQEELIASDSFLPMKETNNKSASKWQHGGTGWIGPWRNWRLGLQNQTGKGTLKYIKLARVINHPQKALQPKLITPSHTGCIEMKNGDVAWRTLKKPIRLNTDAIYYISFFVEKATPPPNLPSHDQYGNISFRTLDDINNKKRNARKIQFGIGTNNLPILFTQFQTLKITPPILYDEPYFFIGKIVASQNSPDQMFLRVFSQAEIIPNEEPLTWSRTSAPFHDSTVYEHVRIHVGTKSKFFLDELRIGTSWESVTNSKGPDVKP
ncbi:hypothetical protein [uncultured Gimesia sp.]|uniref:hypothetical protein n=1 Tax=uncultured Gimesia sp. TaxID=1678688 RepID=UPI00262E036E|nr:hypothetical protein [uncultured Gimesia sp.]